MIKGPKAILSSAIANALSEYFVIDASSVESNLLRDAKIVLRRVELRERTSRIPLNSAGKGTVITVTGCVEEVAFTWAWSVGDVMWVNDAVLTVKGAKFQARLDHEDRIEDVAAVDDDDGVERSLSESFVNPSTIDDASAKKMREQRGGLGGFVERQVKMVIDSLTLKLLNYELRIVLPHPMKQAAEDSGAGVSSTSACNRVIAAGGDKVEVLSFGREQQQDAGIPDGLRKLKQRITLTSFVCGIHLEGREGEQEMVSYPLLEPFSYSAEGTRLSGERFGSMLTGMEVLGLGQPMDLCPDIASVTGSGLRVHMGAMQIDVLMQLSVMMLAPPDGGASTSDGKSAKPLSEHADSDVSGPSEPPSTFTIPLSSASLVLDGMNFRVDAITMRYTADGTVCKVEAAKMEYESDAGGRMAASDVVISMRPTMRMTMGSIDSLFIPDTVLLSKPIQSCEVAYEGSTLVVKLDAIDVVTFSKQAAEEGPPGPVISAPNLPCNIILDIKEGLQIKKSEDGSLTKVGRFHLYALMEEKCAKIAIQFESYRNYLVAMNTVSFCGTLPLDEVDIVRDFIFSAGDVTIVSGHSTDEWSDAFRPRKVKEPKARKEKETKVKERRTDEKVNSKLKESASTVAQPTSKVMQSVTKTKQPAPQQQQPSPSAIKLPYANINDLKVVIGIEATHKIGRVSDTSLAIKAFRGKADTTSRDLINYYTKACLSRVPTFISNAEVLGLNVVDSTTGLWATWAGAGLGLGSTFGAGAGVAAITAVDAVKGAVDAGKRSRNVSEDANWKPGDFMRGLVQAAGEATRDGAAKRGKTDEDGNLIDWTVGATSNTADYVVENKNRLGAAGAGGGGFLLGMALGGPIGAVVGGLVATATTGVALESLDEFGEKQKEKKQIEDSKEKNSWLKSTFKTQRGEEN